jgi:hypothetical protein
MTDLEKFIETYKQFGIEIKTHNDGDKIRVDLNGCEEYSTISEKFGGYVGFYSDLEFTKDGKFVRQGFYE